MAKAKKVAGKANGTVSESKATETASEAAAKPAAKKAAKRRGRPRGAARKARPAAKRVAKPKRVTRRERRSSGVGRRYTPAERARILATASREGLSGLKAAKRFGISALTFYTWRKKAGGGRRRGPKREARAMVRQLGRSVGATMNVAEMIRRQIQAEISRMTPDIIKSEVGRALSGGTARRRRG